MKRITAAIIALALALSAAPAFASQPVGGAATAAPCRFELSGGYFYSKDKWDSNTIEREPKFTANTYYGQLAFGFAPGWDIYMRGGASDSKSEGNLRVENDGNFFGGFGFHGRFGQYKPWHLAFGPVGNIMFYENWKKQTGSAVIQGTPVSGSVRLKDHYSASIGIGLQWTPIPCFTFFTGPFYFYEKAKLEFNLSGPDRTFSDSDNMKTKKPFGPRFGMIVRLSDYLNMTIEGQYRDYLSGGASIGIPFP